MTDTLTPTTRTNDKTNWLRRLKGERVIAYDGDPDYGFYRIKRGNTFVPVFYWYDEDDNYTLVCEISGRRVDDLRARETWKWALEDPITEEVYDAVMRGEPWPDVGPTDSNNGPDDDSFDSLTIAIEKLAKEAEELMANGAATEKAVADLAANKSDKLSKLWKRADAAREAEKAPHWQACKDVEAKWKPLLNLAELYKRLKAIVLDPYLIAEKRKREAAERKAREEAEAAARTGNEEAIKAAQEKVQHITDKRTTAGSIGRSVGLRTFTKFAIDDRAQVLKFFEDREEITDALQKLGEKATKAGIAVPGGKVTKEERSV
jgi:hypothetical protein